MHLTGRTRDRPLQAAAIREGDLDIARHRRILSSLESRLGRGVLEHAFELGAELASVVVANEDGGQLVRCSWHNR